jgi:hypothetical protein
MIPAVYSTGDGLLTILVIVLVIVAIVYLIRRV